MPIYDYKCADCNDRFQKIRKITDDSIPECDACGSSNTSKLISPSGFVLKGSGWYLTDYAKKAAPAASSSSDTPAAAASSGTSSDP